MRDLGGQITQALDGSVTGNLERRDSCGPEVRSCAPCNRTSRGTVGLRGSPGHVGRKGLKAPSLGPVPLPLGSGLPFRNLLMTWGLWVWLGAWEPDTQDSVTDSPGRTSPVPPWVAAAQG